MRTTLTLEDDVAREIERLRKERDLGLKEIVNAALRRGLAAMEAPPAAHERFRTRTVSLGRRLLGNLDDVAGVLAAAEGEDFA